MSPAGEIVVVPFHARGHTFPAIELSRHLASRGLIVTLFLPSRPSSSLHANIHVVQFSGPPPPPPPPPATPIANHDSSTDQLLQPPPHLHEDTSLEDYFSKRSGGEDGESSSPSSSRPPLLCAVVDVMMSHWMETCDRHGVPVVSFFTSSGCAAALEHAASKLSLDNLGSIGTFVVPGLPEDMALTASDLYSDPPPPGAPQVECVSSNVGPSLPFGPPLPRCPPPPAFGRGHAGRPPPPPFHCDGPPPYVAPGHGGVPISHPLPLIPSCGFVTPPPFRHGHPCSSPLHHDDGIDPPAPPRPWHYQPGGLMQPFRLPSPPPPQGPSAGHTHSGPGTRVDAGLVPAGGRVGGGGGPPRGLGETSTAAGLLFNTCDELERPFLDYLAKEAGKPVWGVGPLLPTRFWSSADGPVISDEDARPDHPETNAAEGEIREWLDSKPPASVIYISFGTLVGPNAEELATLAAALEESDRPFIWVLQVGSPVAGSYFPDGLARRAKESRRGLVVRGWAPQLMILSHPSTAAFLSHCGWNSTAESLARGVPMLAWPVKGDQVFNAKLVTSRLRVGYAVRSADAGPHEGITKEEVASGIERLMADEGMRVRAGAIRSIFAAGFPRSSMASIDAFVDSVTQAFREASS